MLSNARYSIEEVIQDATDFDIIREKPKAFHSCGIYLVCAPVKIYQHAEFVRDFIYIVGAYQEIFREVDWFIERNLTEKEEAAFIAGIMKFATTDTYATFTCEALPWFIAKWCMSIKKQWGRRRIVSVSKSAAKRLGYVFTIDELLKAFLALYYFNFDSVKKNLTHLREKLYEEMGIREQATSSVITRKHTDIEMPTYSDLPFSEHDWKLFETLRTMNE